MTDEHDRYERRMDEQDTMLREILTKMALHKQEHENIDPALKELVSILKGIKFLKATIVALGALVGSCYMAWLWAKDHIKL